MPWQLPERIRSYTTNLGTGTFIAAVVPGLPAAWRFGAGVVTLVCLVLDFQPMIERFRAFVAWVFRFVVAFWKLLLILAVIVGSVAAWRYEQHSIPRSVREARAVILDIQRAVAKPGVKRVSIDKNGQLVMRGYDVLMAQHGDAPEFQTFIRNGAVVAEDVRTSNGVSRKYYRGPCNFATDYFEGSGRFLFLEYDPDCTGRPEVYGSDTPMLFPPIPLLSY